MDDEQHDYETIGHLLPQEDRQPQSEFIVVVEHHAEDDADLPTVFNSSRLSMMSKHSGHSYHEMLHTESDTKVVGQTEVVDLNSSTTSDHSGTSQLTTSDYSGSSSSTINMDKLKHHEGKELILDGEDLISYQVYGTI